MIECAYCGTKYNSLPHKDDVIACKQCGANKFVNNSSNPKYGYTLDVQRKRLVRYAITGGSCGALGVGGSFKDFSGYGISKEEYESVINSDPIRIEEYLTRGTLLGG